MLEHDLAAIEGELRVLVATADGRGQVARRLGTADGPGEHVPGAILAAHEGQVAAVRGEMRIHRVLDVPAGLVELAGALALEIVQVEVRGAVPVLHIAVVDQAPAERGQAAGGLQGQVGGAGRMGGEAGYGERSRARESRETLSGAMFMGCLSLDGDGTRMFAHSLPSRGCACPKAASEWKSRWCRVVPFRFYPGEQ